MATRTVKVTGIAEWAKVFEQNRDLTGWKPTPQAKGNYEDYDGACTINLILDDNELSKLTAVGLGETKKSLKPDPEGRGTIIKFDRKFNTGSDWSGGAPVVTKSDDSPWDYDIDGSIGNGSTVEATLAFYDIPSRGIVGTRLQEVKVLEHVQYIQPQDDGGSPPSTKKPEPAPAEEAALF